MNKIGRLIFGAVCIFGISQTAFAAAHIDVFDDSSISHINGTALYADKKVSVCIFGLDKLPSDAENALPGAVIYANQFMPEKDLTFSVPVDMNGYETGEYRLSVYQEREKVYDGYFPYAKPIDSKTALQGLNEVIESGDNAKIIEYINNNRVKLEFSSDYDSLVSIGSAVKYIIQGAPYDINNKTACANVYKKAMLAQSFAEGKITSVDENIGNIDVLNKSPLKDVYAEKYITDTVKQNFGAKITSLAPYASLDDFDTAVCDALILTVVNYPTGADDISSVISKIYPNFPETLLNPTVCRAVMKNSYKNLASLKTAMENVPQAGESSPSKGSGSKGGGGTPIGAVSNSVPSNSASGKDEKTETYFDDMDGAEWAKTSVDALVKKGIIAGRGNNKFAPNESITREEFVKLCVVLFKLPADSISDNVFNDVTSDMWCYPYIKTAYGAKIINGISSDEFGVGRNVTRQDAMVILNECIKNYNLTYGEGEKFADDADISDYAKSAVENMRALGIISGYTDGTFCPKNSITRAEAAKILFEADERIDEI